jgi:putative protein-disulfide isomerase
MKNQANNALLCDIETGMCEIPVAENPSTDNVIEVVQKPVKVIYFTDPICSSCWGIEPQLRKLKLQYGNMLDIEYRMGGLLRDWGYNSGGISKPSDVAHHWDEVSVYYDMPIDGDVWLEDPLPSSYPPSIAFKAAQIQDEKKAILFLREIREMVFLQKKNITKWEHLSKAAENVGLDAGQLRRDYDGKASTLFLDDLELARNLGIRGFPTMIFADASGNQEKVYGSKPYDVYVQVITRLHAAPQKQPYATDWQSLFTQYPTLTSREYAELSTVSRKGTEAFLQKLMDAGQLEKHETKNGVLWKIHKNIN